MMFLIIVVLACPTLSYEVDGHVVRGDQFGAGVGVGDVADDGDAFDFFHFLIVTLGDGEEQFVVLAPVESVAQWYHIFAYLLADARGLVVDGDVLFIDFAAAGGLFADVEQFAREAVADVNHAGGHDATFAEFGYDVESRFGLEVALEHVVVAVEVGLRGGVGLIGGLFAFEYEQTRVGAAEVAGAADEVVAFGAVAIDNLVLVGCAYGGHGDYQAAAARGGVASDEIDVVAFAATADAVVEFFDSLDRISVADGDADENLQRDAVHGGDIAKAACHGFIAEVFKRSVGHVELNAFGHGVG